MGVDGHANSFEGSLIPVLEVIECPSVFPFSSDSFLPFPRRESEYRYSLFAETGEHRNIVLKNRTK